ncbi:MAG TPA: dephospho-CoA kinase [Hyphomicrobiaceae bacterium]|nr:dephospho-CoA kinase [Hyphomicrobiaceae bacterium]
MLIIGLTGSIGMGKSTVAKRFSERGIGVCDADALVHELYKGAATAPIEAAFPGAVIDGQVDRGRLSAALMAAPEGFKVLEGIVHPLVKAAEVDFLRREAEAGARCAVLEVPLLMETHGEARMDVTVVVSAPADVQRTRVLERPGMTVEKFEQIVERQMPDEEKRRRADFVVDTGQDLAATIAEVDDIIDALSIRQGSAYQRYWATA